MKSKIKSFTSVVLIFAMILMSVKALDVKAADNSGKQKIWSGKEDTSWYKKPSRVSDDGKYSVYEISTAEELAGLGKLVREGNTMENTLIQLKEDICLNDTSNYENWGKKPPKNNWTPIGIKPKGSAVGTSYIDRLFYKGIVGFAGMFDGCGHVIKGLYCDHDNRAGLFANLEGGKVFRVILEDAYIHAENYNEDPWDTLAGGIAAELDSALVYQCEFDGRVSAKGIDTVQNGMHYCAAGGIAGYSMGSLDPMAIAEFFFAVELNFAFTDVTALSSGVSGIIKGSSIINCINTGEVRAERHKMGTLSSGGIIGYGNNGNVINCVDLGENTSTEGGAGAVIGSSYGFYIQNCFYSKGKKGLGETMAGGSADDTAINFVNAGYDKDDLVKQLSEMFVYKGGDLFLSCDTRVLNKGKSKGSVPKAVSSVESKSGSGKVVLSWKTVKGAVGYDIYRYDPSSKVWEKYGVVGKKSGKAVFTDNNVTSGTSYKYKIRAYGRLNGRKVPGKMSKVFKAKTSKSKAIK